MLIAIAVVCTLCEAVFTAMEIAIGAVSRSRLRAVVEADRSAAHAASETAHANGADPGRDLDTARRRARRLLRLLEEPERLTLMFIIVTSLSLWTAASALAWQSFLSDWPVWVLPLTLLLMLFIAEVLPLLLAAHQTESVALHGAKLASVSLTVLSPLMLLLGGLGRGLARLMGAGPDATAQVTEGELRTALAAAEEEGVIESDERAMLEGAMDFRETRVREVMTPRIDMVAAPADASLPFVLDLALREGHTRVPIYENTPDVIVGIVSTKDLIPHLRRRRALSAAMPQTPGGNALLPDDTTLARDVARPVLFVPQDKRIAPTLEDLRRQRTLMAIVIDESGGTAGLVTLEDLLEEIVGEIQDEYDEEEPEMKVLSGPGHQPEDAPEKTESDTQPAESAEEPTATALCNSLRRRRQRARCTAFLAAQLRRKHRAARRARRSNGPGCFAGRAGAATL
jgi:CBS domain containing-hemolysin-like protein